MKKFHNGIALIGCLCFCIVSCKEVSSDEGYHVSMITGAGGINDRGWNEGS